MKLPESYKMSNWAKTVLAHEIDAHRRGELKKMYAEMEHAAEINHRKRLVSKKNEEDDE